MLGARGACRRARFEVPQNFRPCRCMCGNRGPRSAAEVERHRGGDPGLTRRLKRKQYVSGLRKVQVPQFSGRVLQLLVCSASGTHRDKLGPMGYS